MAHKVYYQYKHYEKCPEATRISKSRSRFSSMVLPFIFFGAIGGIIASINEAKDGSSGFVGTLIFTIICIVSLLYMIFVFPMRTDKKIEKAIKLYGYQNTEQLSEWARHESERNRSINSSSSIQTGILSYSKGIDENWTHNNDGFVVCPRCSKRLSYDFIIARRHCLACGCEYVIGAKKNDKLKSPIKVSTTSSPSQLESIDRVDEKFIKDLLSENSTITREDALAFQSVINSYKKSHDKIKTLDAFDSFVSKQATSDPKHAMEVNEYFCKLLGKKISLSEEGVTSLIHHNETVISKASTRRK